VDHHDERRHVTSWPNVARWTDASGTHWSRFSLNPRGFVSEVDEQNRFAADGTTIIPATEYRLADRTGSLAKGKLAELALIDGDPSKR
jgi:hypothetical protein